MKDKPIKETKEIKQIAEFKLQYQSNLDNLAQALLKCGYFVSYTDHTEQVYTVRTIKVYTDRF